MGTQQGLEDFDPYNVSSLDEGIVLSSGTFADYEERYTMDNLPRFPLRNNLANQSFPSNNGNLQLPSEMVFGAGHLISAVTYSSLFIFSLIGNAKMLFVILQRRRRNSSSPRIDFMLLHLCIADLIVTLFMMPLEISWAITVTWRGGDILCRVMAFFRIVGLYLSSFVLVCLATDRYLAVTYPLNSLGSGKRGKVMIICAWTLSILCSLPQVYIFHVKSHPDFPWYKQCVTFGSLPESLDLAYRIFCLLMMHALPFAIILILYCGIVVELQHQTRDTSHSNNCDGLRRSSLATLERAREKTQKMTVAIVAAFFICWAPYNVMCLWYMIDANSAKYVDQRIQRALFLFACTNSTVNPIVYGIFHLNSSCTATRTVVYSSSTPKRSSSVKIPLMENTSGGNRATFPRHAILGSKSLRKNKNKSVRFSYKKSPQTETLIP